MRCGLEPAIDPDQADDVWNHDGLMAMNLPPPDVCVGYVRRLPIVTDVDMLKVHWERQSLAAALGGEIPEIVLQGLTELDAHTRAAESWGTAQRIRELEKRGGR